MNEYKCGKCGKLYTFEEYIKINCVCPNCGYVFHVDRLKMQLKDKIKTTYKGSDIEVFVSTVFLEMNHGFDEDNPMYWETMIFKIDKGEINYSSDFYQDRYKTKKEAYKEHKRIVKILKEKSLEKLMGDEE